MKKWISLKVKSVDKNEPSYSLRDTVSRREFRKDNLSLATGTIAMNGQSISMNSCFTWSSVVSEVILMQ
jgi:hypothetical protein